MTKFRLLGASALALISVPLTAAPAPRFDPARLSKHVKILGSDAFEGRGPATRGETKTVPGAEVFLRIRSRVRQ